MELFISLHGGELFNVLVDPVRDKQRMPASKIREQNLEGIEYTQSARHQRDY